MIPNARVGYQPGYGVVADSWPQGTNSSYTQLRIMVLAAVKNDLGSDRLRGRALPQFRPDFGPGPPSPANLDLARDIGKYINSFAWRGDPIPLSDRYGFPDPGHRTLGTDDRVGRGRCRSHRTAPMHAVTTHPRRRFRTTSSTPWRRRSWPSPLQPSSSGKIIRAASGMPSLR